MVNKQFATTLHIMTALAYHETASMNSEILAKSISTNPVVVRRILQKLAENGLVKTQRGKNGGVRLAQKASAIKLSKIYECVQDRQLLSISEKPPLKDCAVSCSMKKIMETLVDGVEESVVSFLDKYTLAEVLKKIVKT